MNPSFRDIRDRLGEPAWWMEGGIPRYCDFSPDECGVYSDEVALVEIGCQYCDQRFRVAVETDELWRLNAGKHFRRPSSGDIGSYHYGDPPVHGCVGDTMNVVSVRVLEFWRRHHEEFTAPDPKVPAARFVTRMEYFEWRRFAAHECEVDGDDWAKKEGVET